MEPRHCRCVTDWLLLSYGCTPRRPECCCNGTGKVWASVEGEVVTEEKAIEMIAYRHRNDVTGEKEDGIWTGEYHLDIDVPGPGRYRVIVQPLKEGE